jgi:NDP-sugar pyrophosphorylase family protein
MTDLKSTTAMILAGGLGTRLRSVVPDRPKVLAEIAGRPYLAYLLEHLATAGLQTVVLCVGYLGEQVETLFGSAYQGLHLKYSQESTLLGTGGALRLALPLIESDCALVLNGDSFCTANLREFWAWHQGQLAEATLLLTEVADTTRYGRVEVQADGKLLNFAEKGVGGSGWISAGIYLLQHQILENIPSDQVISLEQDVFPKLLGRAFYGYQNQSKFIDIGTPESYGLAEQFLREEFPG